MKQRQIGKDLGLFWRKTASDSGSTEYLEVRRDGAMLEQVRMGLNCTWGQIGFEERNTRGWEGKERRQGRRTAEMGWVVELERRTDGKLLYPQAGLCRRRKKWHCCPCFGEVRKMKAGGKGGFKSCQRQLYNTNGSIMIISDWNLSWWLWSWSWDQHWLWCNIAQKEILFCLISCIYI